MNQKPESKGRPEPLQVRCGEFQAHLSAPAFVTNCSEPNAGGLQLPTPQQEIKSNNPLERVNSHPFKRQWI